MKNFFDLKNIIPIFKDFFERVESVKSGSIFGVCDPLKIPVCSCLSGKKIYITADFMTAGKVFELFSNLA